MVRYLITLSLNSRMPNVTLAVPEDLHRQMRAHPEIKWSEIARSAFRQQLRRLDLYDRVLADSKLTERDAVELGREIRRHATKQTK